MKSTMKFLAGFLPAVVMVITMPGVSYAQLLDLKAKAVETLTNGVMKELEKKFTEIVGKEAISAAAKTNIVNKLSEMSRPIVKDFIDSATSGRLPNQAELVNSVMKNILPRVQELVAASIAEGAGLDTKIPPTGVAGATTPPAGQPPTAEQIQSAVNAQLQQNYDDEKDFTVETINEGSAVRIIRYTGKNTELRIPPRIGNRPVIEIGERAFLKKGLVSVAIPESVIFIGSMAFAENQIGSISIGADVYITSNAFDSPGYNSFSSAFYNSQGRKAGTYTNSTNNWILASSTPTVRPQVEEKLPDNKSAPSISGKEPATINNDDSKLHTLGISIGIAPDFLDIICTLHGTFAPFNNSFVELGLDAGFVDKEWKHNARIDIFSLYPFANYAFFLPFPRTAANKRIGGWYAGAGVGVMFTNYTFTDVGAISDTCTAMNIFTGFNLGMFDISYTLRTDFNSFNGKLAIGYVYRFN